MLIFDAIKLAADKGIISPTVVALALVGVVMVQSGVDARQDKAVSQLSSRLEKITETLEKTSVNLGASFNTVSNNQVQIIADQKVISATVNRIDEFGSRRWLQQELLDAEKSKNPTQRKADH